MSYVRPVPNCDLCPRLKELRDVNKTKFPDKFNAPVPAFGDIHSSFLIVGLAPGLKGANFTGRPFTGDYAGDLLYKGLTQFEFAHGDYRACPDDGLRLDNCRISNAVKCVPPQNKPTGEEIKTCRRFFADEMTHMVHLKAIMALGLIAHNMVLQTYGYKQSLYKFGHAHRHVLPNGVVLFDSYHCSRYNTQTGRLTEEMFFDVLGQIRNYLAESE